MFTLALKELNDSGQSGWAALRAKGDQTEVVLSLLSGTLNTELVHIHSGSCGADTLGGVEHGLTSFVDGSGFSVTTVDVPLSSLRTGDFAVNSHKKGEPGVYTSCGNIPAGSKAVAATKVDVRAYSSHQGWARGEPFVFGGVSEVVRTPGGVSVKLQSTDMEPGAWTLWWTFYNHPEKCQNPQFDPAGNQLSRCSNADKPTPGVGRSGGWGGSAVVDASGEGSFSGSRMVGVKTYGGDMTSGLGDLDKCCPLLTNPMGAEVHIKMRYHGPVVPHLRDAQLGSWGGGCSNTYSGPSRGAPGDFDCQELSIAVHSADPVSAQPELLTIAL